MDGSDLPEGTANDTSALGFEQGVEALADILGDPETDLKEDKAETQASDEAEPEGEEPEGEADDEELVIEEDPEPSEESGPAEIKGGQFAPDTAKVTLEDGSVISIADLKRNNLFQRDYSRKTEELKQEREQLQTLQAQAHEVAQYRDFVLSMYQQAMPQPPDKSRMETDIIGYWQDKEAYDEQVRNLNQLQSLKQYEEQQKAQNEAKQFQQTVLHHKGQLLEKMPHLKDPARMTQFKAEAEEALSGYGYSPEEASDLLSSVVDHRLLLAVRDIIRLKKALKKAPEVKQQVQQKPKLISGGKRMDPKARTSREAQVRSEHLRKTGSFDAGVASLMDLDL